MQPNMRQVETGSPQSSGPALWMSISQETTSACGLRSAFWSECHQPEQDQHCQGTCSGASSSPALEPSSSPHISSEAAVLTPTNSIQDWTSSILTAQAQAVLSALRPGLVGRGSQLSRMASVVLLFLVAVMALPLPVTALESENVPGANNPILGNGAHLNSGASNGKNVVSMINSNDSGYNKNKLIGKQHNAGNSIWQGNALGGKLKAPAAAPIDHKLAEDPLKQLALQQKQRAADAAVSEMRRKEQIQQQIEDHEKRYAAKQQQMEEKERLRKDRERILAEKRLSERQKDAQEDKEQQFQGSIHKNMPVLNQQQEDLIEQHRQEAIINTNSKNKLNIPKKGSWNSKVQQAFVKPRESFGGALAPGRDGSDNKEDDEPEPNAPKKYVQDVHKVPEPVNDETPNKKDFHEDTDNRDSEGHFANARDVGVHFRGTTRGTNMAGGNLKNSENGNGNYESNVRQEAESPKENNILGIPIEQQPKAQTVGNPNPYEGGSNNFHGGGGNYMSNHENSNNAGSLHEQQQYRQPEQSPVGGMNLAWDWEDFSISFNNYGAAELKVRRSPHPTTGEPWPLPQYYSKKDHKVYRVSRDLKLVPTKVTCDILEEGLSRHLQRILRGAVEDMYDNLQNAEGTFVDDPAPKYQKDEFVKAPFITRVEIRVRNPCSKYPALESDETYDLVVKRKKTYIWANEVWGALRGLETLGQLVWRGSDGHLYIKETVISDYPRFPHRGLHIDTSRHFLFKEVLLDIIDSMEMNKLNVFHWHIVDDQSFPYESKVYPELSRKGAYHPTYVYSLEDIAEIIEYARLRGVRVMPEFDTPGHTYSWGLSRPELLTQCYSMDRIVKGYLGPIDPSKNATYRFLEALFQEVVDVFQDTYLHLGGDEVPLGCWQSNPEVMAFANHLAKQPRVTSAQTAQAYNNNYAFSMWSDDIKRVYEYYENRLINIISDIAKKRSKKVKYVMWQEVMNNNLQLPNDTIIQVWMGDMADVSRAISMGYQVLYSTCWYLDHIEYGTKWPKYYQCDPADNSYEPADHREDFFNEDENVNEL
ncbi:beta-hexosaminidase subunit beta, partial [Elysia marginata]